VEVGRWNGGRGGKWECGENQGTSGSKGKKREGEKREGGLRDEVRARQ